MSARDHLASVATILIAAALSDLDCTKVCKLEDLPGHIAKAEKKLRELLEIGERASEELQKG